ncbi:unknown [Feldmannia species virus]|uniref:Uncharacterized protein n=1 Tax=Feldmannia species virus TaxID=39420 RepID=B5LWI8_9PHYC|nr:hypothetical protein FeldSpV_gp099 [Feldmannia species virus]ACH46851.1 unknown [Feldmannia species virus]
MEDPDLESKAICTLRLENLLLEPIFTIFRIQHDQVATRTETPNSLLYHFKKSMASVEQWNSITVRDFCNSLVTRFPQLDNEFVTNFAELQQITCKILNRSSELCTFTPSAINRDAFLHCIISECSNVFIDHPVWFAVEESSPEYRECKNHALNMIRERSVLDKCVVMFLNSNPKGSDDDAMSVSSSSSSSSSLPSYRSKVIGGVGEIGDELIDDSDKSSIDSWESDSDSFSGSELISQTTTDTDWNSSDPGTDSDTSSDSRTLAIDLARPG